MAKQKEYKLDEIKEKVRQGCVRVIMDCIDEAYELGKEEKKEAINDD